MFWQSLHWVVKIEDEVHFSVEQLLCYLKSHHRISHADPGRECCVQI